MSRLGFIDFAAVRRSVSMEQVLAHYNLLGTLTGDGAQRKGPDPFSMATAGKSKPFAVNFDKNVWTLFRGDKPESGSVLDFVMRKELCSVRQAAVKLTEWFTVGAAQVAAPAPQPVPVPVKQERPSAEAAAQTGNAPLSFELKGLDPFHESLAPILDEIGVNPETVAHFGAGLYSGNGKTMKGKLAVPIDRMGKCVGYMGIDLDPQADELITFPQRWTHGIEVYNLTAGVKQAEEMAERGDEVHFSVYRYVNQVWQAYQLGPPFDGIPIAVMGETMTPAQLALLNELRVLERFVVTFHLDDDRLWL